MESRPVLVLALCSLLQVIAGLNLDPLSPTVVNSALVGDFNDNIRQFGFDVTQHRLPDGRIVALVSAPRDNNTEFDSEGGVYQCPMEHNANCEPSPNFLSHSNINPLLSRAIGASDFNLDFQLMGYRLRSFPEFNHVAACAPAYRSIRALVFTDSNTGRDFFSAPYTGRCVVLDSNLTNVLQVSIFDIQPSRLLGLDVGFFTFRDPELFFDTVTMDGDEGLVISAGFDTGNTPPGRLIATDADPSNLGFNVYHSMPDDSGITELEGFNFEFGFFTNPDFGPTQQAQIAVSAPRHSNHLGRLQIFEVTPGIIVPRLSLGPPEDLEANGYFGYDFAVFDWNVGGYHSIVVGCPLCDGDRGAVYVYVHSGTAVSRTSPPWSSVYRMPSPSSSRGRFGMSIANLGDIICDSFDDVAISAPYAYDGMGAVYIYKGYSNGLVPDFYQELRAVPGARAFGYAMRGDLDVDDNGFRDLTVTDLSGNQVTTLRGSPLVNVRLDFNPRQEEIDLTTDRRCSVSESITLLCFDVVPCFQYTPVKEGRQTITQFAIRYNVSVDSARQRVQLLEGETLRPSFITEEIVLTEDSALGQFFCRETALTFVVRDDFTDTAPIPVQLSVQNADELLELESDPNAGTFGGPLHPTLNFFISGDEPAPLTIDYNVEFNVSCDAEEDPSLCEPEYELIVTPSFTSTLPSDDSTLVLARENQISFQVDVTNMADDEGLSPQLTIDVPPGILFLNESEPLTVNAFTTCDSPRQERVECQLQNPFTSGMTASLLLFFRFDEREVLATLPDMNTRSFTFTLVDSLTNEQIMDMQEISIVAIADYSLTTQAGNGQYQAIRLPIQETTPFESIGPEVSFSILVSNNRPPENGTLIPHSTLIIHVPVILESQEGPRPLLVPTEIVSQGRINCTHFNAIPAVPAEFNIEPGFPTFLDAWTGPPPTPNPECNNGFFRCGIILCTVEDLEPVPPPSQITLFARLFSPTVIGRFDLSIYATIENNDQLPEVERVSSESMFQLAPAVLEMQVECIKYWIVVVSVVVGIAVMTLIITVLGCLGVFRRWYKVKKEEEIYGPDQPDTGLRQRTIPPIPGVTRSQGTPELLSYEQGDMSAAAREKEAEAEMEEELEKERERERERELQLHMELAQFTSTPKAKDLDSKPSPSPPSEKELQEYKYDPSKGIEDGYEGPETEI